MKLVLQRVRRGKVTVKDNVVGEIGPGFVALVGVRGGDSVDDARLLAEKTVKLRVFADQDDRMNLALKDTGGAVLAISQFTLYADTRKGNRPSFIRAAPPEQARAVYESYVDALRALLGPPRVATGEFGAMMLVDLVNDGPVTIELNTDEPAGVN